MDLSYTLHIATIEKQCKKLSSDAYDSLLLCIDEDDMAKFDKHFGCGVYLFGYGMFSEQFLKFHINDKLYYLLDVCSLNYIKQEISRLNDSLSATELNDIIILMMQVDVIKGGIINITQDYFKSLNYANKVFDQMIQYVDNSDFVQISDGNINELSEIF